MDNSKIFSRPDRYDVMLGVIRLRMRLHYLLHKKGAREARKIFVIGYPRSGTTSLHRMFLANGLNSRHSAGDWDTARFDCFSDFGQVRPFRWYARDFPNSVFVLNTRPTANYLLSLCSEIHPTWRFTPEHLVKEVYRRAVHFENVLTHFHGTGRLCVVNIEAPGALDFVAGFLGLQAPDPETARPKNTARKPRRAEVQDAIEAAFARLGLDHMSDRPVILPKDLGLAWGKWDRVEDADVASHL